MKPKDKEEFLQTYTDSKCLAEALEKCHVSEYAVRCECAKDETFSRKFREIAKAKARKGTQRRSHCYRRNATGTQSEIP